MADFAYARPIDVQSAEASDAPRHSALVRITHWINAISFFAFLVSGIAILLAHPRLYWGETGGVGTPSLIDLPLPFVLVRQSGWGRSLHFLTAWVCLLSGSLYALSGFWTLHFRMNLLPAKADLAWDSVVRALREHFRFRNTTGEALPPYNVLQRLSYLSVVFILFPVLTWTGFAMSPAIVSVFPGIVTVLGGQQSARTIHFFAAAAVVMFFLVHIAMVTLAGFTHSVKAMITGGKEST